MARRRGKHERAQRHLPVRVAPRGDGSTALEVGGVVQSIAWPASAPPDIGTLFAIGYWELMLPPTCPPRALLLGLGGGTVAALLARRCPGVAITGIESDALVLATARAELGLDDVPGLVTIQADAFAWIAEMSARIGGASGASEARFDYIAVDLFEAGRLVPGTLATPFLRQVASLLTSGGMLAINLALSRRYDEQRHRLARVFSIERERRHVGNVVIHARPLSEGKVPETAAGSPPSSGNGRE